MIKLFSAILIAFTFAGSAQAGSLLNTDKVEHKIHFTYVGNTTETIALKPGETHYFRDPWLEILIGGKTTTADYRYDFAIQNGQLVLVQIRDSKGAGLF